MLLQSAGAYTGEKSSVGESRSGTGKTKGIREMPKRPGTGRLWMHFHMSTTRRVLRTSKTSWFLRLRRNMIVSEWLLKLILETLISQVSSIFQLLKNSFLKLGRHPLLNHRQFLPDQVGSPLTFFTLVSPDPVLRIAPRTATDHQGQLTLPHVHACCGCLTPFPSDLNFPQILTPASILLWT